MIMENNNNQPSNLANGWDYISAIFKMMTQDKDKRDFLEQHFLYRGISKRYFSESPKIKTELNNNKYVLKQEKKMGKKQIPLYYCTIMSFILT